jgi:hypothetical protein
MINPLSAIGALGSGIGYELSGGRVGSDITPNGSLMQAGRTQLANATGTKVAGLNTSVPGMSQDQLQALHNQGNQVNQQQQASAAAAASGTYDANNAASARAAAIAQYGDPSLYDGQIQSYTGQINGLQGQADQYLQNNANDYNLQGNRLRTNQANDQQAYDQQVQQNTQSYQNNRTKTLNSSRSNANALQRLLGLNGAGNSSAALEQAPYAAALQGSQDIADAQQTYSMNGQNLGTNWKKTQDQYKNAFEDLDNQKYQADNGARSKIAQARADLLDKLATADVTRNLASGMSGAQAQAARAKYQPEIDSLLHQVTQLGSTYDHPIQAQNVQAAPLSLADYAAGRNLTAQNSDTAGGSDIQTPFLSLLAGNKKDQYGNPLASY